MQKSSLKEPSEIQDAYKHAYNRTDGKSTILVEFGDFYNEKGFIKYQAL